MTQNIFQLLIHRLLSIKCRTLFDHLYFRGPLHISIGQFPPLSGPPFLLHSSSSPLHSSWTMNSRMIPSFALSISAGPAATPNPKTASKRYYWLPFQLPKKVERNQFMRLLACFCSNTFAQENCPPEAGGSSCLTDSLVKDVQGLWVSSRPLLTPFSDAGAPSKSFSFSFDV